MAKQYWLMKSEPDVFSIDDLERDGTTCWEGIRNYEARNTMRDRMKVGDEVLFYHSNASPPGVAGIARVSREAYPDHFAFDAGSRYFDPKSDPEKPRWFMVDLEFAEKLDRVVPLAEIREAPALGEMVLLKRMRLSIQPVTKREFETVRKMGRRTSSA
ncbi:MAG: EVE domain-containing protein [Gemmatimonadota bacterium]